MDSKDENYNFYEWILDSFINYRSYNPTKSKDESDIHYSKPTHTPMTM